MKGPARSGRAPQATGFDDCLRRCEPCGIGASNASDPRHVTFIYRNPLHNIPLASRPGAEEALRQALNECSRVNKLRKFGFSTSEDAVTWVVFTELLRSGRLPAVLAACGAAPEQTRAATPALLLWGVPIEAEAAGASLRANLIAACDALGERSNARSEPDVIIDYGHQGIVFIEVKYGSANDDMKHESTHWARYQGSLSWNFEAIQASGCYELTRNWRLMHALAQDRPCRLVNLGPESLFEGKEGARLEGFIQALHPRPGAAFAELTWSRLLSEMSEGAPDWFVEFCRARRLLGTPVR